MYIGCDMHGKFSLRPPHSCPASMLADDLATDTKVSEKDAEGVVGPVVENKGSAFTTTRWELWAFYVYYIVSFQRYCQVSRFAEADSAN